MRVLPPAAHAHGDDSTTLDPQTVPNIPDKGLLDAKPQDAVHSPAEQLAAAHPGRTIILAW